MHAVTIPFFFLIEISKTFHCFGARDASVHDSLVVETLEVTMTAFV
jgi:hypothetical protein